MVPKKNISQKITDIFRPNSNHAASKDDKFFEPQPPPRYYTTPASPRRTQVIGSVLLILVFLGGFGWYRLSRFHTKLSVSTAETLRGFHDVFKDSGTLFGKEREMRDAAAVPLFSESVWLFQAPLPFFKDIGEQARDLQSTVTHVSRLLGELSSLQEKWPELLFEGEDLLERLLRIRESLKVLDDVSSRFTKGHAGEEFPFFDAGSYLAAYSEITRFSTLLDALIPWLQSPDARRIIVFLQNTSEMRPTGGFWGSFIEFTVQGGHIVGIETHDIGDVDRTLETKIVPPQPLQRYVRNWRTADANWFFDFPRSAEKAAWFFEVSPFYEERPVPIEGVFALSPRVVEDILARTGPIELPQRNITITRDNFLKEIQKVVQAGHDAGGYAKEILQELVPLLVEELKMLPPEGRREMLASAREWFDEKDWQIYMSDQAFQTFAVSLGSSGSIFPLPQDFNGDYLAVVAANIGGGKSDLFIKQKTVFQSQISEDGTVSNHLAIDRRHDGKNAKDWWHRASNVNYLRVFTPASVRLTGSSGGSAKRISPPLNYAKDGYASDPDVVAVEETAKPHLEYPHVSSLTEAGRNVFSTWVTTAAGKTSSATFDYTHRLYEAPRAGGTYQFVFEKQAGVSGEYHFEIHAPVGFRWRENNLPVYEYHSADPPGRLMLSLTFEKI